MYNVFANANDNKPAHKRSFGENMFDLGVYGGVGFAANAALSIALTYEGVMKPNSRMATVMTHTRKAWETVIKSIQKNPQKVQAWTDKMNEFLFLSSGGYILLVPMKWLEDNKEHLVEKLDDMFGTGPENTTEELQEDLYFDSQPKQSYATLFGGRIIAHPVIVAGAIPVMENLRGTEHVSNFLNKHFGESFKQFRHPKKMVKLTSEELILSGTAAVLLYAFSKSLAMIKHKLPSKDEEDKAIRNFESKHGDVPGYGDDEPQETSTKPSAKVENATHMNALQEAPTHDTYLSS
ncbi:MAG: hypothetical protein MRY32_02100 [Rickettsiales bacterium]|nr:hypothetical protein [Rickettsiales bacterium]